MIAAAASAVAARRKNTFMIHKKVVQNNRAEFKSFLAALPDKKVFGTERSGSEGFIHSLQSNLKASVEKGISCRITFNRHKL